MEINEEKEIDLKAGSSHNKSPLRSGADEETGDGSYTSEEATRDPTNCVRAGNSDNNDDDPETEEILHTSEATNRGNGESAQDVFFCTSWVLLITSFVMGTVCSVLNQLKYPLESMVLAYVALCLTTHDLILVAGTRLMKLGRRINYCASIAISLGSNRDLIPVYGFRLAAALWQAIYSTLQYKDPNKNTIRRIDPLPFIFLLFVIISRSMNSFKVQPDEPQSTINGHGIKFESDNNDEHGSNIEQANVPSNPSEAAANVNLSEMDSNSSRADEAHDPPANPNLSEDVSSSTNELGSADHGYGPSKMDQNCQSLDRSSRVQETRIDKGKETITEANVKITVSYGNVRSQVHEETEGSSSRRSFRSQVHEETEGSSSRREASKRGRRASFRERIIRFCRNWFFLITCLVLEGVCALLDQLNSPLGSMVVAYVALLLTILDELMIAESTLLRSKWNELLTIVRWYGLASALWQCLYSTLQYKYSDDNPVRMNLQLSIFLLFVIIHRWNLRFVHHRNWSTMEHNGESLEMNEPKVDEVPSNPSEAAANVNLSEMDSNSSRADEAKPVSNTSLLEKVSPSTKELGSVDHGYGSSKMDQNYQSLEMDYSIEKAPDEAVSAIELGVGIDV